MLSDNQIFGRVRSAFADAGLTPPDGELTLGTNYAQLVRCHDGIGATALALGLSKRFGLEIPEEDILEFETVRDLVGYISGRLVP